MGVFFPDTISGLLISNTVQGLTTHFIPNMEDNYVFHHNHQNQSGWVGGGLFCGFHVNLSGIYLLQIRQNEVILALVKTPPTVHEAVTCRWQSLLYTNLPRPPHYTITMRENQTKHSRATCNTQTHPYFSGDSGFRKSSCQKNNVRLHKIASLRSLLLLYSVH